MDNLEEYIEYFKGLSLKEKQGIILDELKNACVSLTVKESLIDSVREKININDYIESNIPTMEDINKMTQILKQEEDLLAELIEKKEKKRC